MVDIEKYCVMIVSPRNHFLFTPMLPATAVGSVEFRSLLEPGALHVLVPQTNPESVLVPMALTTPSAELPQHLANVSNNSIFYISITMVARL